MERGKGEDKKYIQECSISAEGSHAYSLTGAQQAPATDLGAAGRDYILIFHTVRSGATRAWHVSIPE